MAYSPADPFPKSRGDAIRSQDWNDAVLELQRLDTAKINRAGDGAITGSLTVSGNLGVGTTSPGAKLHVAGGGVRWGNNSELVADQGGSIELGGNNTTAGTGLPYIDFHFSGLTQDFNTRITNDANGRLSLIASTLQATGNVGIGTASPQRALSVNAALNVDQANANNGAVNPGITFGSASGEGIASKRTAGGNQAGLDLYTNNTARLSITNSGGIGIGTTNPQYGRLMIEDASVPISLRETGQAAIAGGLWRMPLDSGVVRFDANTAAAGDFSTYATPLAMTAAGNVGIGAPPPANYRLMVQITGGGTDEVRGVQAQASGAGTGNKFGVYGQATGTGEKLAGYFEADSAGNEPTRGGFGRATGAGTGNKYGVHGIAGGGGEKYGGFFEAQGGDTSWTNAIQGNAYGAGTGPKYGVYGSATGVGEKRAAYFYANSAGTEGTYGTLSYATGDGTGNKFGVQSFASGGGTKYAGWFDASSAGNDFTNGVYGQAYGDGTGMKTSVRGWATGGGEKRAGWFEASSAAISDWTYGIVSSASTAGSGPAHGVYSTATGDGTGFKMGVRGIANGGGWKYAGYFDASTATAEGAYGIYSQAYGTGTGPKYGIFSYASGGGTTYAGYFAGNVWVTGNFNVSGTKSFVIDHPLDPENKTLRHNVVESPENLCLYRGKVKIGRSGRKMVRLPDYFAELTNEEEATVYLTSVGKDSSPASYQWDETYTKLTVFGTPESEVAYLVIADRDDPTVHMLARPVEEEKGEGNFERGQFLNPEAFEQPAERGVAALPPQEDAGQPEVAVPEPVPAEQAPPGPAPEESPQPEPIQPTRPEAPAGVMAEVSDEQEDRSGKKRTSKGTRSSRGRKRGSRE